MKLRWQRKWGCTLLTRRENLKMEYKYRKKRTKSKGIPSVLSILGKQVRDNSGSCLSDTIACVLLWEHPWQLGVYLLAHGTRRQSHHKVVLGQHQNQIIAFQMVLRSTPPSRLSCGLRFWMWNVSLILCSLFQRARSIAFICHANQFHVTSTVHGHAQQWLTWGFVQV